VKLIVLELAQAAMWRVCAKARDSKVPLRKAKRIYSSEDTDQIMEAWKEWSDHDFLKNNPRLQLRRQHDTWAGPTTINAFRMPDVTSHSEFFLVMASSMATGEIDGIIFR
jgi:hypothetical protein